MANEKILVVDDDRAIVEALTIQLKKEGFEVAAAYDGYGALDVLAGGGVDLLLIDVMMPQLDGFSAIMRIREKQNLPILVMSAKTEDTDKILGLSIGADDYITKPFNAAEVVARVKSHLRRYYQLGGAGPAPAAENVTRVGRLSYDFDAHQLSADGAPVRLTATETRIVELLFRNPGRIFSAEEIYSRVWQEESYACENTVMVHIRHIREKTELNPKEPEYIKVVWGLGYKLEKHGR
ncbi:response regulator transcription factor [Anaerofilum sp. BX8]|uniref:Stage 0 sporulation protein A homolog n=1 Tax=Anaerofilum hominis TaxID=2763016 RepID=A0A923I7T7_9FIRM|nr:response regulator transcription factor [Anaerofilum hominis]MBC5580542.1 response regulator transcription factor [Anaerofilum hominis]